jgi:phosphatidylglycerophosphate synthase
MYYFTDEEVNGILKYKWFPEVSATKWECFLSDKLYKPLEYFIFWKLNANFLTLLGPLPMIALTIWQFFLADNPPRFGPQGREGSLLSEEFLLAFGLSMIFSSLIDAFDGIRARRQGCGSTFGGFFDCFMDGVAAYLETNIFLYLLNFEGGANPWNVVVITLVPPMYMYAIQMRMMNAHKAKYNWWQVGPTESESLIGFIILLPVCLGRDVYETVIFLEYGIQAKHLAAAAYFLV